MLSSVLRSDRAVAVNIEIMRTFVALRRVVEVRDALRSKLGELEKHFENRLADHDTQLAQVFSVLRRGNKAARSSQYGMMLPVQRLTFIYYRVLCNCSCNPSWSER